jgi:mRNA-degrading endonuclease toxin of MazEF toxin-antitoxin module
VVWTWVPFEEDASQGKDRPVVVMGRPAGGHRSDLVVLMLSSKDHHGDERWLVLGKGAWDLEGRVSSVRLDRVLAVAPAAVRREGAALERDRFDHVATALRALHGWA